MRAVVVADNVAILTTTISTSQLDDDNDTNNAGTYATDESQYDLKMIEEKKTRETSKQMHCEKYTRNRNILTKTI